ncbi:MAG: glycosyltransferase [Sandarakinorhabdus sp.]|nr:glycosyltransferase [Sandarakinorhabdus sp.]
MIEAVVPVAPWTVIVPFYNEHVLLPVTLHSLAAQTRQTRIIPVDNGSNDGNGALAEAPCRHLGS